MPVRIIAVCPHYCGACPHYCDGTSEIFGTLLEPLKHEGLMGRTFLHDGDSKNRSDWQKAPVSNIPLLIAVCELAGCPYDDESTENLASCKTIL